MCIYIYIPFLLTGRRVLVMFAVDQAQSTSSPQDGAIVQRLQRSPSAPPPRWLRSWRFHGVSDISWDHPVIDVTITYHNIS